jgi:hypothetical protein
VIDMGHHRLSIGKISGGATNDAIGRPVGHARPANRRNHLAISASMNEGPGPYPAADLGGAHSAPPRTRACLRYRTNRGRSSSVIRKSASDPVSFRRRSGTELAVNRNIDAAIDTAGDIARQLHFGCAVLPRVPRHTVTCRALLDLRDKAVSDGLIKIGHRNHFPRSQRTHPCRMDRRRGARRKSRYVVEMAARLAQS